MGSGVGVAISVGDEAAVGDGAAMVCTAMGGGGTGGHARTGEGAAKAPRRRGGDQGARAGRLCRMRAPEAACRRQLRLHQRRRRGGGAMQLALHLLQILLIRSVA